MRWIIRRKDGTIWADRANPVKGYDCECVPDDHPDLLAYRKAQDDAMRPKPNPEIEELKKQVAALQAKLGV